VERTRFVWAKGFAEKSAATFLQEQFNGLCHQFRMAKCGIVGQAFVNTSGANYSNKI
jgi:hypothetical protein